MRELIARAICALTLVLVVALSFAFAVRHNPGEDSAPSAGSPPPDHVSPAEAADPDAGLSEQASIVAPPPAPPVGLPSQLVTHGATVYARNACATCHSISGEGNPRYPLDGCGNRWTTDELRAWVTGTVSAAAALSEGMRRRKARYQNLPAEDLDALVAYLATLRQHGR